MPQRLTLIAFAIMIIATPFAAVRRSLMALNGQTDRCRICPLSDHSGQRWGLAPGGFVAF